MTWKIEYTDTAKHQLKKLDKQVAKRIMDYMDKRIGHTTNPKDFGKVLSGPLGGLWRYRVGDYRIICEIHNKTLRILVLDIGNRKDIYK